MESKRLKMDLISDKENSKDENIKQKRNLKSERKKKLKAEIEADGNGMIETMKIETKRRLCDNCGRSLAGRSSLSRHKKTCKGDFTPVIMMWNGKSWNMKAIDVHYKLNLGRDMADLLEREVIKKEDLTRTQMECIQMYKSLFKNVEDET